jgi:hypothetical protein
MNAECAAVQLPSGSEIELVELGAGERKIGQISGRYGNHTFLVP